MLSVSVENRFAAQFKKCRCSAENSVLRLSALGEKVLNRFRRETRPIAGER